MCATVVHEAGDDGTTQVYCAVNRVCLAVLDGGPVSVVVDGHVKDCCGRSYLAVSRYVGSDHVSLQLVNIFHLIYFGVLAVQSDSLHFYNCQVQYLTNRQGPLMYYSLNIPCF